MLIISGIVVDIILLNLIFIASICKLQTKCEARELNMIYSNKEERNIG